MKSSDQTRCFLISDFMWLFQTVDVLSIEGQQSLIDKARQFKLCCRLFDVVRFEDLTTLSKYLEVKCSTLRFFVQLLRTFDNQASQMMRQESALDLFLANPSFKNTISQAAFSSRSPVVQALAV